jgi:anaerobic magnesium-protoporphyrin IX monomethyl ester cyclase
MDCALRPSSLFFGSGQMETTRHSSPPIPISGLDDECWMLGLIMTDLPSDEVSPRIARLLQDIASVPAKIRDRLLVELLNFLELADVSTREQLASACLSGGGPDHCGCTTDETISGIRTRLADAAAYEKIPAAVSAPAPVRTALQPGALTVGIVVPQFLTAPSFLQPPLCVLLAAARLRAQGHAVRLVDNRVHRLPLATLPSKLAGCDVVAVITTPYDHIQNYFLDYRLRYALRTVDCLKAAQPDRIVAVCGAHGTVRPDIVFADSAADYVVRGEFDTALPAFIEDLASGDATVNTAEVVTRGSRLPACDDGGAIPPFRLVDLGDRFHLRRVSPDQPRPAYDLINFDDYRGDTYDGVRHLPMRDWATALASRGCSHDCSFCYNFWGRRVRYREPEEVADELAWLEYDYNIRRVFFLDFNFSQSARWIGAFAEAMRRRALSISWVAQTRCDAVSPELLAEMKSANCAGLWFGVESFDWGVAAALEKYRNPDISNDAIEMCQRAGIQPHLFIMIGLPGESRTSLNTTIRAMHRHKAAFCGVMPTTPRFGTTHYRRAKAEFPQLGRDFYSLRSVRGLVGNDLQSSDLVEAMEIMNDRRFVTCVEPPQLPVTGSPRYRA